MQMVHGSAKTASPRFLPFSTPRFLLHALPRLPSPAPPRTRRWKVRALRPQITHLHQWKVHASAAPKPPPSPPLPITARPQSPNRAPRLAHEDAQHDGHRPPPVDQLRLPVPLEERRVLAHPQRIEPEVAREPAKSRRQRHGQLRAPSPPPHLFYALRSVEPGRVDELGGSTTSWRRPRRRRGACGAGLGAAALGSVRLEPRNGVLSTAAGAVAEVDASAMAGV
jgi:hypothetical protein